MKPRSSKRLRFYFELFFWVFRNEYVGSVFSSGLDMQVTETQTDLAKEYVLLSLP